MLAERAGSMIRPLLFYPYLLFLYFLLQSVVSGNGCCIFDKLIHVNFKEDNNIAHKQRSEYKPDKTKQTQPHDHTQYRDYRMYIAHSF